VFVEKRFGMRLLIDSANVADQYLLAFGFYEERERRILFSAAAQAAAHSGQKLFLDVGAHAGYYALWASQSGIFDRIVAIEADPRNAGQLRANLFLNGLSEKIEVVEAAASDSSKDLEFWLGNERSRDVSRVVQSGAPSGGRYRRVPAVSLDELCNLSGGLLVAKIDVEGFEEKVVAGARGLLTRNQVIAQIEVFPEAALQFEDTMKGLGFWRFAAVGNDLFYRNFGSGQP